jgi:glycosyltransferase involved in cell wall biosynthesis
MSFPRVTVICLCYNQARFVRDAIRSVLTQTYENIELIVVDDASTDNSVKEIREELRNHTEVKFIQLPTNKGNCRAFNHALSFATGEYLIDLAADDILLQERIAKGVVALTEGLDTFGVNFTDAEWIAEDGTHVYRQSDRFPHQSIPTGDIYKPLIERFFICSPSMMFSRRVIDVLGGYDELLAYEDFDFWIRSSRLFKYCYTPEVLIKKRIVKRSMSEKQFTRRSPQLRSTYRVCEKILDLNRSDDEKQALAKRIRYEIRLCLKLFNFSLALDYTRLYWRNRSRKYS